MLKRSLLALSALCAGALFPSFLSAQDAARFTLGVTGSSLGAGIQGSARVTHNSSIRVGFNAFNYTDDFSKDGVHYTATLKLRSAQATFDQYIMKTGFHISPGVLLYNGNEGTANATVPAGQSFSLGSTTYYSSQSSPVSGAGALTFNKVAPMILLGYDILHRHQGHFGVNIDAGVIFQGSPKASLNLNGSACGVSSTVGCLNAATDPTVQSNVQAEDTKINNSLSVFKYYPVIALTFSYKF